MNQFLKMKYINPFKIYGTFLVAIIIFTILGIPLLSIGYSSGEQRPFVLLGYLMNFTVYVFFILAILLSILRWKWFIKYWYFNILVIGFTGYVITSSFVNDIIIKQYDFTENKIYKGKDEIIIQTEYYQNTKKIRSKSFYLNNKKDSIWSVYDFDGEIISKEIFKNDLLLRKEK